MSGDYTRFTFKPLKDYSGLFKQQGRVDLDSDFNELIEIIDRRWRSETIDIIGHGVVPSTTPDAFMIRPTAMGDFDIGIGRMYVDGIQVENHGRVPLQYLPDLGEQEGTLRTLYSDQPYLPAPTPPVLTPIPDPRTDLIYIDVWQREVTVLEDPSIREVALGGPDTTTRIQSAWQVRALKSVGRHGCGDDIAAWDALIAPSAGRLTTSAVAPPASDDPCIISPSGGYRGLENRLYRVEIHATGTIGGGAPAKFKWSRNNASIASNVSAIPAADEIIVQQLGRDEVLRFEIGNFIEITDDFREFQSQAGHMALITNIDQANSKITFAPPIPAPVLPILPFDATDKTRHTRVVRWDQTQNVDANGLLDVVAGTIPIEDGVQVQFGLDPAGGNFKVGDYWVFSARTADGSVEQLTSAPPKGILHHYCRLGFMHWGTNLASTTFDDCRIHWPLACECDSCTVTVGDGVDSHGQFTDIQEAINALGNRGGIVCVGRGFYRVTAPLLVDATKRNVRIVGTGPATRIVFDPAAGADRVFLRIRNTKHVALERVFVAAVNAASLIEIINSSFCRVEDCILVNLPFEKRDQTGSAIEFLEDCSSCEIQRNALLAARTVSGLQSRNVKLLIRDNQMLALQASVLLRDGFSVEIVHNKMLGLPEMRSAGQVPTRASIDEFQHFIVNAFQAIPISGNFQAAGVVIFIGAGVVISQNLIVAQAAIIGFLFLNARILQNDIASLVGILLILGAVVKVEDNFILALFAGVIIAGIIADLDCTSNEFLGLNGILWMSLTEFLRAFANLFEIALTSAGFVRDGDGTVSRLAAVGTSASSDFGFGAVIVAKIHRNLFLTFDSGIRKSLSVLSADVSIVDNTFTFCQGFGIRLDSRGGSSALPRLLRSVINLRHLIQSNSFAIVGRAIVSSSFMTQIEQNSIQCPSSAIDLDAEFSTVRNNTIMGTASGIAASDQGLITLQSGTSNAIISGNILQNATGHAILILEDLFKVAIHDNLISGAMRFGIGGLNEIVSLSASSIERNRIEGCQGQLAENSTQPGGAVSIGAGANLRFIGNTVTNNAPATGGAIPPNKDLTWVVLYFEDIEGIEISENLVTDNANIAGLQGIVGAVRLKSVGGTIRVQQNVIKDNGGFALQNQALRLDGHSLVQDNLFASGLTAGLVLVRINNQGTLMFQGNRCMDRNREVGSTASVVLGGGTCNVSNNVVTSARLVGMRVDGGESVVNANIVKAEREALVVSGGTLIVTSNLTTALVAPTATILVHNIPPP